MSAFLENQSKATPAGRETWAAAAPTLDPVDTVAVRPDGTREPHAVTILKSSETQRAQQFAQLAQAVYTEEQVVPGWRRFDAAALSAAGLDPAHFDTPTTGFKAAVFQDETTGEFALAFAGTEDLVDNGANIAQGMGVRAQQYEQAVGVAVDVVDSFGLATMVGHSLGGGLAATAAIATRSEGVTFNAAGVHANTIEYARTAKPSAQLPDSTLPGVATSRLRESLARAETSMHITNYRTAGEALTAAQGYVPLVPSAQGRQLDVSHPDSSLGALERHQIMPTIDAVRGRELGL